MLGYMSLLLQIISTEKEGDLGDVVKERESRTNLSNQSAFLYSPQPSNILLSHLSLSLSLSVPNTPRCALSLSPCYVPPLHLPVSLSFSVVSHGDTNAEDSKFKQDK